MVNNKELYKKWSFKALGAVFFITLLRIIIIIIIPLFLSSPILNNIGQTYENESYSNYTTVKGKVSKIVIEYAENRISNIPSHIVEAFIKDGGKIYITDNDLNNILESNNSKIVQSRHTLGFFSSKGDNISIWLHGSIYDSSCGTTEHEFGHYLDWKCGWISEHDSLFKLAFEKERESFKHIEDDEYFQDPQEYFAESFKCYCINPKELEKNCPITYNIIENISSSAF
jgi:hypothetical protein